MINVNNFRRGMTVVIDDELCRILEFQHVKNARGAAFVRTKVLNIDTGTVKEVTLNPNDRYERAIIDTKEMQYLYNDGESYYFMDNETYDQIPVFKDVLGDSLKYIKENETVEIQFYKGRILDIDPGNFVELEVTQTEQGVRGDTTGNALKPAIVETGATINVPLFVNIGDVIKIDTRTGEYQSRV